MKQKLLFKFFLIPFSFFVSVWPLEAANRYVRAGAAGNGSGSDWTNAYSALPTSLVRGDTYYIADGSYGSYTFDDANSGSTLITLKKATAQDHGTDTGWSSAYSDGQAVFGDFMMITDYYVIDGQTRDESNWENIAAYGFRVTGQITAHGLNNPGVSDNVTYRYLDVGGPAGDTFNTSIPDAGFYLGGFGLTVTNWTITRCHIHNVYLPFQMANASGITIEYSWLGPNWSKETIRGQVRASNITIRHNILKDGCQGTPGDPTAGGCTAQIAMWDGDSSGDFDGSKIYGNLIRTTKGTHHSDACIMIGGDGNVTAAGVAANNVLVYNNTFAGIQSGTCNIRFPGSHSGDVAQNNIWYGLASGVASGCSANTCTNNVVISAASQFLNAAGGNFRLAAATAAGTTLAAPYNTDMDGKTRGASGVWDLGAYEFGSGGTPPPISCDLNSSGAVNISDVQLCANQAITVVACTNGDVDDNSACNVLDVQRVANGAMGGTCP